MKAFALFLILSPLTFADELEWRNDIDEAKKASQLADMPLFRHDHPRRQ